MIATIMVFGRLSAESEILAAQAGGAALRRFVWPLFLCGFFISQVSLWLQDEGVHWGNETLRSKVLMLNNPDSFIKSIDKPGHSQTIPKDQNSYTRINMLAIKIGPNGEEMHPIQIITFLNNAIESSVFAEDHTLSAGAPGTLSITVSLKNAQFYEPTQYSSAGAFDIAIPTGDPAALISLGNTRGQKSWRENMAEAVKITNDEHRRWEFLLRRASDFGALAAAGSPLDAATPALIANEWTDVKLDIESIVGQGGALDLQRQDMIEYHRKIALARLPISMIFLGIGLGLLVKKSNRMIGFLLGLGLYVCLFYPMTIIAKTLSSVGTWDKAHTFFGRIMAHVVDFCPPQYLPNIVFLVMGYLLWRMFERGMETSFDELFQGGFKFYFRLPKVVRIALRLVFVIAVSAVVYVQSHPMHLADVVKPPSGLGSNPLNAAGSKEWFPQLSHTTTLLLVGLFIFSLLVLPDLVNILKKVFAGIWWLLLRIYGVLTKLFQILIHVVFRRTTDKYVGVTFLTPLIIVIICIAGFITAIDVIDHLSEIIDGIRHSLDPMGTLPPRSEWQAVIDVFSFYGIQSLEYTLELLPAEVLIAGMLCAMVLVRNQEHLILKSSGVRLQRAMRPAIFLAIVACLLVSTVREMWMPELLLYRDALKPQVYHRNSQPTSLALFTLDENKKPLLFEMGQYNTAEKRGKELCIYLLAEQKNSSVPIPTLTADVAVWNADRAGWDLFTDPAVQEMKLLEQSAALGGGKSKDKDKDKDKAKDKDPDKEKEKEPRKKRQPVVPILHGEELKLDLAKYPQDTPETTLLSVVNALERDNNYGYWMAFLTTPDHAMRMADKYKSFEAAVTNQDVTLTRLTVESIRKLLSAKLTSEGETGGVRWFRYKFGETETLQLDQQPDGRWSVNTQQTKTLIPGGMRYDTELVQVAANQKDPSLSTGTVRKKSRVDYWQGPINPKYIDSDRMGAKVMRLDDLRKLSELKPEMMVEFFRRVSEFAMGFLLLWCALPLMLNDSSHGAIAAIGISVIIAAVYWALCLASVKLAGDARVFEIFSQSIKVPLWAPLIPHGIFFIVGFIQFYWRMET